MRVLVTGANGFVGQNLCAKLIARGIQVRALVRHPSAALQQQNIELQCGDITDEAVVRAAVDCTDAIVHLAARVHIIRDKEADPLAEFRRVNVEGTRTLAAAARDERVPHFVFVSSVKAVGDASTLRWDSSTPAHPVDPYGVSKLEAEHLLLDDSRSVLPHVTVLRFPLVYGPGMKGNMLRLFRLIARGLPIPVGRSPNSRSILFVGNAVAAIDRVLDRGFLSYADPAGTSPLFVADGPGTSTSALVHDIAQALGTRQRTAALPHDLLGIVARMCDPLTGGQLQASLDRLFGSLDVDEQEFERKFDFQPPYTRQQGLAITAKWFHQL